ncbi:MAG TPA: hypothetical protein VFL13_02980 [Candidatus Baltobacteraceae bacterium]|nr:hypothetical protein [Candidatus Baltobacteraceae bacterium]
MFSALLLAATVASAPAAGTYSYVSTMNGSEIGHTKITLASSAQGLTLTESGAGNMNGQSGSVNDTLTLDARLQPLTYTADASVADSRNMRSTITFDGATAKQTGDVSQTYPLIGSAKHFVLLDVGPFSGFFMMPAQLHAWNDQPVTAIVPNFAHSMVLAPEKSRPERPSDVPAGDAVYAFNSMVAIAIWYNPHTLIVDQVDVPAQGLIVKRL